MADQTQASVDELLEAGNRALDAGNYAVALDHWTQVLSIDPQNRRAARLVEELEALIRDKQVATMTPMSGEFVVVVDDEDEAIEASGDGMKIARGAWERLQRLLETHEHLKGLSFEEPTDEVLRNLWKSPYSR